MSESSDSDVMLGFVVGALLGAAAGLLLAPRSGRETRRRLQRWAENLEDRGYDLLNEGRDLLEEGREVVQEKADQVKDALDKGRRILKHPKRPSES